MGALGRWPVLRRQQGHVNQSTDFSGNSTWIMAGENSVKLYDGQSYTDIGTSLRSVEPRFATNPTKWSSCQIGQVVFLNHPQLYPIYWVDGQAPPALQPLPWHRRETGRRGQLVQADPLAQELPVRPRCRRAGRVPRQGMVVALASLTASRSWRPTAEQPDSIAGWVNLGRGGSIVGGESLRDSFVIYSESAINVMDFTGDALGWRRRTVSSEAGLASSEALVEVQGTHFFISPGDIQTFDGNSIGSIMHNRLRKRLAARMNVEKLGNSWAAHNPTFNEIWFAVPETGEDHLSKAYAFNYRDNNWSIRDLKRPFRHAHFGVTP